MAVRVTRQHGVERRHPRVEIGAELAAEGLGAAECCAGDLFENWRPGAAREPRVRPPIQRPATLMRARCQLIRHTPVCSHTPRALSTADDVVADAGADDAVTLCSLASMAVIRNSATVMSRRSPSSRCSSAPNERGCRSTTRSARPFRVSLPVRSFPCAGASPTGLRRPPRNPGPSSHCVTFAARAGPSRSACPELAKACAQLLCLSFSRKRVAARSDVLHEGLERLRHGELRAVGILRSSLLGVDSQRSLSKHQHDNDRCRQSSACDRAAMAVIFRLPDLGQAGGCGKSSTCSWSAASPRHCQRRPPGMRTSTSTGAGVIAQTERSAQIALRQIAAARADLPQLLPARRRRWSRSPRSRTGCRSGPATRNVTQ